MLSCLTGMEIYSDQKKQDSGKETVFGCQSFQEYCFWDGMLEIISFVLSSKPLQGI